MIDKKKVMAKYWGYQSCVALVGEKKAMLIEFKYDGKGDETFLRD